MNQRKSQEVLGVFAAFLLALLLRMVYVRGALIDGDVLFYGYDSFYHMRRILYTADHFPSSLWSDAYLNYPHGLDVVWPPLFDQIVAVAVVVSGAGAQPSVEVVSALVPPVLGAVTVLVLYLLAKEIFDERVALLSAFILAMTQQHVRRSCFGYVDHHVLETLLLAGVILLLTLAISRDRHKLWFAAGAGCLMAALAYAWIGTPAYLSCFLVYLALQLTLDVRSGRPTEDVAWPVLAAFLVALTLMTPHWNDPWLSPSFFTTAGILTASLLLYAISKCFNKKNVSWMAFPLVMVVVGYIALLVLYNFGLCSGREAILLSLGIFTSIAELSYTVSEAMPLSAVMDRALLLNLLFALLGLLALIMETKRPGNEQQGRVLFFTWTVLILALTVFQNRFLYVFAVNMALLISLLLFQTARILQRSRRLEEKPEVLRALTAALFILVLLPTAIDMAMSSTTKPEIAGDWYESLQWLRENSPSTSGFDDPGQLPEYGVMSWWDYGNWIVYESERPVVANNFQAGATDSARFYLSTTEDDALAILAERGCRYAITDESMLYEKHPFIASWIDEDPSEYLNVGVEEETLVFDHTKKFMDTTLAGLHLLDCNGMGHLRLIYESDTLVGERPAVSRIKIFERVAGARITGTTGSDQPVGVVLDMATNQGRRFQYFNYGKPEDERYEIVVPYSTEDRYGVDSDGPYVVFSGGVAKEIDVSEEDVILGKNVVVNF